MSELAPDNNDPSLVAWRLGRVEKAVDDNHRQVVSKLEQVLNLNSEVEQVKYRVTQLEVTIKTVKTYLGAVGLTLLGVIVDLIVRHL